MSDVLAGKRILIVEDEYFIASDLKRALAGHDAEVVGPVGDLDGALALLNKGPLDAAVLDVNLEGAFSYPVADELKAASVPYVFLTGYDAWALPDEHRDSPRLAKPFAIAAVVAEVERLCAEEKAK